VSKKYKKFYLLIITMFFMSSVLGCDKISSFLTGNTDEEKIQISKDIVGTKKIKNFSSAMSVGERETPMPKDAVLRIKQWVLTSKEFKERVNALKEVLPNFDASKEESKKLILEEIISQHLLALDAEEKGLQKEKEIAAAIEEFKKTVLVRENAKRIVSDIEVTEKNSREYYDANIDAFKVPEEWRVREIVVAGQLKANEILLNIMKGEDFVEVARQNSISDTAKKGGDLGFIVEVPFFEMASALSSLAEGGVSNVFKGPQGYYIVKVEEKRGGRLREFDEIKEQLTKDLLVAEQQKAIFEYISKLKENIKVETNVKNIE